MRCCIKLSLSVLAIVLTSCVDSKSEPSGKVITYTSSYKEHSYDEVKDKHVFYSDIFSIESNTYYVYFYSTTCSHCNNLKEFIISLALQRDDIYFVEASQEIVFLKSIEETIGLTSIEGFGILGYPSLIKIEEHIIKKNIAGILPIRSELLN